MKNKRLLSFLTLLMFFQACKQQEQNQVIVLDENLTNLNQLAPFFQDKRIVFLGEPSHGDGTIFEARIALIKYLHQFHAFNTIIFESSFYDAEKINDFNDLGNLQLSHFNEGTFDVWGNVEELDLLWNYIIEQKNLKFAGMDFQPHYLMRDHFISDVENVLDLPDDQRKILFNILHEICGTSIGRRKSTASEAEINVLLGIKDELYKNTNNENLIVGINTILNYLELYDDNSPKGFWSKHNFRDSIMFENLKLHAGYNNKIIVWLASAHSLESPEHIIDTEDLIEINASYKEYDPIGKLSKKEFGDKQYNIAFTGYQGAFRDFIDGQNYAFKLDTLPTIEKAIAAEYKLPTFLPLSRIDSMFYSGVLGYEPILANWQKNFDAVIIIPEVKPSTFKK